jgi:hypothetical protein
MDREDGDQLVIEVPGGGSVGCAGFGDPDGVPCLAFHGQSSSRLMPGWMFPPELLAAAGVRMIGVDRPGYGDPTPAGRQADRHRRTEPADLAGRHTAYTRRILALRPGPVILVEREG